MSERRVVVTGLGAVTSMGTGIDEVWAGVLAGRSGITTVDGLSFGPYDCRIGGQTRDFDFSRWMDAREMRRADRFCHFAVVGSDLAVQDAALDSSRIDPNRAGVLVGSGVGGLRTLEVQYKTLSEKGPRRVSPFMIPMMIVNMASGLVSIRHGLRGPNLCVTTACATAAHSIGVSYQSILRGDADVMVCGGSEAPLTDLGFAGFCAMKAMSTRNDEPERASRPFDAERDGFVMGEGAAIVVLESLEHARSRGARIYCELCGFGMTGDAFHITAPAEGGEGAARGMRVALADAGINPGDVSYINAHGTSTVLNDKSETEAIKHVFGDRAYRVPVSSTKSMTGHLLGAAGGIELAFCARAIHEGVIPPTINYENPDPNCDLDYVPNEPREAPVNVAISNSLGFGGHNATLVARRLE